MRSSDRPRRPIADAARPAVENDREISRARAEDVLHRLRLTFVVFGRRRAGARGHVIGGRRRFQVVRTPASLAPPVRWA
jgi:hypothetical protein